jgi:hypothetical protein
MHLAASRNSAKQRSNAAPPKRRRPALVGWTAVAMPGHCREIAGKDWLYEFAQQVILCSPDIQVRNSSSRTRMQSKLPISHISCVSRTEPALHEYRMALFEALTLPEAHAAFSASVVMPNCVGSVAAEPCKIFSTSAVMDSTYCMAAVRQAVGADRHEGQQDPGASCSVKPSNEAKATHVWPAHKFKPNTSRRASLGPV